MTFRSVLGALVVVVSAVGSLSAAELSDAKLGSMGLGRMQRMSEREGAEVRGQGIAIVFGRVTAGGSTQSYFNIGSPVAANGKIVFGGGGFSAGGAIAFAK